MIRFDRKKIDVLCFCPHLFESYTLEFLDSSEYFLEDSKFLLAIDCHFKMKKIELILSSKDCIRLFKKNFSGNMSDEFFERVTRLFVHFYVEEKKRNASFILID